MHSNIRFFYRHSENPKPHLITNSYSTSEQNPQKSLQKVLKEFGLKEKMQEEAPLPIPLLKRKTN